MSATRSGKDELYVDFVDVESLSDISRSTYRFNGTNLPIFSIRTGKKRKLFSIAETVGFIRIAYTFTTEKTGGICLYTPKHSNDNEKVEIVDSYSTNMRYKSYPIPIIEFIDNPFKNKQVSGNSVVVIPTSDYRLMVKGVISKSISGGVISNMYMFTIRNRLFIGSFDLIDDDSRRVFVYSKFDSGNNFKFIRYDTLTNEITPTNKYSNDVRISIIHLSKAFDFFKPE